MRTKTIEKVMSNSIVCGYAITQPIAFFVDAQPLLQDKLLAQAESLAYGEHSEIVRNLQYKLTRLGHYEDGIDGVYGLLTEHAVKGFQSSNDIAVTGTADQGTMEALIFAEKKSEIDDIADLMHSIHYESPHDDVKIVQETLFYHGYYKGSIDGKYGPLTAEAINQVIQAGLADPLPLETDSSENQLAEDLPMEKEVETAHSTGSEENEEAEADESVKVHVEKSNHSVIETAKMYIGTPYVWGGTSPNGFDCSGFIQFVYEQENLTIPRTVSEIWNFASSVDSPSIGDLVFFETYQPGPSHMGIYIGNGDFIHAGSSSGVQISNVNDTYWSPRYLGAKRIQ